MPYPVAAVRGKNFGSPTVLAQLQALGFYTLFFPDFMGGTDGQPFHGVVDLGTHGGTYTQGTSSKRPTFDADGIAGRGSANFDGGDCLQLSTAVIGAFCAWAVYQSSGSDQMVYEHSANGNVAGSWVFNADANTIKHCTTAVVADSSWSSAAAPSLSSTPVIVRHESPGTHAAHKLYKNGTSHATTDTASNTTPGTGTVSDTLNVGARNDAASLGLNGRIGFLGIITPYPSASTIAAVDAILRGYFTGIY